MASAQFISVIDIQLPLSPDPALEALNPLLYGELQRIYNAIRNVQSASTLGTVGNALTAAGSNQGNALLLGNDTNVLKTVPAGSGVLLPLVGAGSSLNIKNYGANAVNVYPQAGGQIDALATNAPYVLAVGAGAFFEAYTDTNYITYKGA